MPAPARSSSRATPASPGGRGTRRRTRARQVHLPVRRVVACAGRRQCRVLRPAFADPVAGRRLQPRQPLGIRRQADAARGRSAPRPPDRRVGRFQRDVRGRAAALRVRRAVAFAGRIPLARTSRTAATAPASWSASTATSASNLRIGLGYNFTEFSDDLTNFDYDHKGCVPEPRGQLLMDSAMQSFRTHAVASYRPGPPAGARHGRRSRRAGAAQLRQPRFRGARAGRRPGAVSTSSATQVPGWQTTHPSTATENSGGCVVPAGFNHDRADPRAVAHAAQQFLGRQRRCAPGRADRRAQRRRGLAHLPERLPDQRRAGHLALQPSWPRQRHRARRRGDEDRRFGNRRARRHHQQRRLRPGHRFPGHREAPVNVAGNTSWVRYSGIHLRRRHAVPPTWDSRPFPPRAAPPTATCSTTSRSSSRPFVEFTQPSSSSPESASGNLPTLRVNGTVDHGLQRDRADHRRHRDARHRLHHARQQRHADDQRSGRRLRRRQRGQPVPVAGDDHQRCAGRVERDHPVPDLAAVADQSAVPAVVQQHLRRHGADHLDLHDRRRRRPHRAQQERGGTGAGRRQSRAGRRRLHDRRQQSLRHHGRQVQPGGHAGLRCRHVDRVRALHPQRRHGDDIDRQRSLDAAAAMARRWPPARPTPMSSPCASTSIAAAAPATTVAACRARRATACTTP